MASVLLAGATLASCESSTGLALGTSTDTDPATSAAGDGEGARTPETPDGTAQGVADVASSAPDTTIPTTDAAERPGTESDAESACPEGTGCFGSPCEDNSDCFSGLCMFHMGETVCSKYC
ncbi:MAG: hypothetical protein QF464_11510, partial [Myxococcota bacterium]|nr:hypothetical protein [Myxococcota bacterium]